MSTQVEIPQSKQLIKNGKVITCLRSCITCEHSFHEVDEEGNESYHCQYGFE